MRLRRDVLVGAELNGGTQPSTISLLGHGMVVDVVEEDGDWIRVGLGPLSGWTPAESVEPST